MCHAKYYALLEKKRFLSPIGDNPQKILDLGCGTGESYPHGVPRRAAPCMTAMHDRIRPDALAQR